jgi:hypothetical protein
LPTAVLSAPPGEYLPFGQLPGPETAIFGR